MRLSFLIAVLSVSLFGCASKRTQVGGMERAPTRAELLVEYKPSGLWCIDALTVNLLSHGCSSLMQSPVSRGGSVKVKCAQPQLGATDVFSSRTFVIVPAHELQSYNSESSSLACFDGQVGVFIASE